MARLRLTEPGASFGERVVDARNAVRLRQRHLAQAAGFAPSHLHEIEHGQRSARSIGAGKLYDLARGLGLRMETLLGLPLLGGPVDIEGADLLVLGEAATAYGWPIEDVHMLSTVHFRGRRPKTVEDWWFLYEAIKRAIV